MPKDSTTRPVEALGEFGQLPVEMVHARRWLVWRSIPQPEGKKPRKVPYYVDGTERRGTLDSDEDQARYGTFTDACKALATGAYAGLGFALGPDGSGSHWQGVDLDDIKARPGLVTLMEVAPGYVERSPSGNGFHAIGYGQPFASLGSNATGIEAYAGGRYFTVTGDAIGGAIEDLSAFVVETLRPIHKPRVEPKTETPHTAGPEPDELIRDLRSALWHLDADDRAVWIATGLALKTLGARGRALWLEWSSASTKFDPADAAARWKGFNPTSTDYRAIFAEAQRCGWSNPKKRDRDRGANPANDAGEDPPKARIFTMVGELIANAKPPQWLIRDQLELDALALLWGPPKTGKSFIAIDWACSIATGTLCFGSPTRKAPVFYICGEGHNGLSRRFLAWSLERGISLETAPIAVSNRALPLTHPGSFTAVSEAVEDLRKITGMDPGLIVVDTLARNFGANENDTEAMSLFITHMDGLRAPFKATALIVHHSGKDENRGPRGNLALFGAVDASYKVARDVNGAVNLYPEVIKDGPLPPVQNFHLTPRPLPIETMDGRAVTSCTLRLIGPDYEPPKPGKSGRGRNQTKALQLLRELYAVQEERVEQSGRDRTEARVLLIDWRESCLANGIDSKRFGDLRKTLEAAGSVEVEGLYVFLP